VNSYKLQVSVVSVRRISKIAKKRLLTSSYQSVRPPARQSVCPYVRLPTWNNSAPTGRNSMKFEFEFFLKIRWKIQVSLQSDKNKGYLTSRSVYFFLYLATFFLEREMFQTKVVEKIKTHILCSVTVFRKSHRLWENVEKQAGQAADDNMSDAHYILDT